MKSPMLGLRTCIYMVENLEEAPHSIGGPLMVATVTDPWGIYLD